MYVSTVRPLDPLLEQSRFIRGVFCSFVIAAPAESGSSLRRDCILAASATLRAEYIVGAQYVHVFSIAAGLES